MSLRMPVSRPAPLATEVADRDLAPVTHLNPCPLLGALEGSGYLTPDASGQVSLRQLDRVFRDVLGMTVPARLMFQAVAPTAHNILKLIGNTLFRKVDLQHLRGDFFDHHQWDTGILAGGRFNADAFQRLASYSSDGGKTVSLEEWGRFMKDKLAGDRAAGKDAPKGPVGTAYDASFVTFEAGLISSVLGKRDATGDLRIDLSDLRRLYESKRLPEAWEPGVHKTKLRTVMAGLASSAFGMLFGSKGAGAAQEGKRLALASGPAPGLESPVQGLYLALCPAAGKARPGGAAGQPPTDAAKVIALHEALPSAPIAKPEVPALEVAEKLNKAFDAGDAKTALLLLENRSAQSIERLKTAYAERFGRDLEYDLRGFALDAKGPHLPTGPRRAGGTPGALEDSRGPHAAPGPVDAHGFSLTLRGLKGADLAAALKALHGPRLEANAERIAALTAKSPTSTPDGRREIYGLLARAGGEERAMLAEIFEQKTGKDLLAVLAPVMRAQVEATRHKPITTPPERTVAIVVSSGNWKAMLDRKTDQPIGGYHWREAQAYAKEALARGYTPVVYTPDGLPPSPDAASLLLGKLGPKIGFGTAAGAGPDDSPEGKALLAGFAEPRSLADYDASKFAALHVAGGHGSHQDLDGNPRVEAAGLATHAAGGVVTAVCHATPSLGRLIAGGPATGFSPQLDALMVKAGYVLPEFHPPYDAHQGLVDIGVPMSPLARAEAFANIHHTETIARAGEPPIFTGTGPEATPNVAKLAFDALAKRG